MQKFVVHRPSTAGGGPIGESAVRRSTADKSADRPQSSASNTREFTTENDLFAHPNPTSATTTTTTKANQHPNSMPSTRNNVSAGNVQQQPQSSSGDRAAPLPQTVARLENTAKPSAIPAAPSEEQPGPSSIIVKSSNCKEAKNPKESSSEAIQAPAPKKDSAPSTQQTTSTPPARVRALVSAVEMEAPSPAAKKSVKLLTICGARAAQERHGSYGRVHWYLLVALLVAFIVWAVIFFPILLSSN